MVGYTIRRIIQSIVVVLGVLVIMFILQSLLPDPARAIVGVHASPAVVHADKKISNTKMKYMKIKV